MKNLSGSYQSCSTVCWQKAQAKRSYAGSERSENATKRPNHIVIYGDGPDGVIF